jgi:hypothetical protein
MAPSSTPAAPPAPSPRPAPRHHRPRPTLHLARLRRAPVMVRRPPRHPLGAWRRIERRQRGAALRAAPRPSPRPRPRHHPNTIRPLQSRPPTRQRPPLARPPPTQPNLSQPADLAPLPAAYRA